MVKFISSIYSPFQILFWTQIPALATLLLFSLLRSRRLADIYRTRHFKLHLIRALIVTAQILFAFVAFASIPLTYAYSFIFCAPFFATLLTRFWLKEPIALRSWFCLAAGFIGVLVILRPGLSEVEPGMFAALLSGLLFAIGYVTGRKIGNDEPPLTFGFYPVVVSLSVSFLLVFFSGQALLPSTPLEALLIVPLGVLGVSGVLLLSSAFNLAPVPLITCFHYTQLIWGALFGFILFQEVPDIYLYAGSALIVASGVFLTYSQSKRAQECVMRKPGAASDPYAL